MNHKIISRFPLGNSHRVWKQDNFELSTFSATGTNMRNVLEACADAGFTMVELGWASHEQAEEALQICEELRLPLLYQDFSLFGGMQSHCSERGPWNNAKACVGRRTGRFGGKYLFGDSESRLHGGEDGGDCFEEKLPHL